VVGSLVTLAACVALLLSAFDLASVPSTVVKISTVITWLAVIGAIVLIAKTRKTS